MTTSLIDMKPIRTRVCASVLQAFVVTPIMMAVVAPIMTIIHDTSVPMWRVMVLMLMPGAVCAAGYVLL